MCVIYLLAHVCDYVGAQEDQEREAAQALAEEALRKERELQAEKERLLYQNRTLPRQSSDPAIADKLLDQDMPTNEQNVSQDAEASGDDSMRRRHSATTLSRLTRLADAPPSS